MRDERPLDEKLAPQELVRDFVWAARAVFNQPSVAFVSVALWCLPTVLAHVLPRHGYARAFVYLGALLFMCGWSGVERTFFLARRDGHEVTLPRLLGSIPFFIGRFLRLGLLLAVVAAPLMAIISGVVHQFADSLQTARAATIRIEVVVVMVPIDIALTFVTSALAFTTRSARQALRIGREMIGQTWPRSGLYVLCPPLALNMLNVIYPTNVLTISLLRSATLAVLALVAKGATAAFYLRERPISPDVVADAL